MQHEPTNEMRTRARELGGQISVDIYSDFRNPDNEWEALTYFTVMKDGKVIERFEPPFYE